MIQRSWWLFAITSVSVACTLAVDSDIKGSGFGSSCTTNDDCHAGFCAEGVCSASCTVTGDCPGTTQCLGNRCYEPLKVSVLHIGYIAGGEGWTLTHNEGITYAKARLPYLEAREREGAFPDPSKPSESTFSKMVDEEINTYGAKVVVANSFSMRDEMIAKAKQYPNIKFINALGNVSKDNYLSIGNEQEQAWWVAGRMAALQTKKNRLGFIASFITPEVVRYASAFFMGAYTQNQNIRVEVQWLGFWSDYRQIKSSTYNGKYLLDGNPSVYREELLTYRLLEGGADVIAHSSDTGRSVRLIEALRKAGKISGVYSISNDNAKGCNELVSTAPNRPPTLDGPPMISCLAAPYWNWGPLYVDVFKEIYAGKFDTSKNRHLGMTADPTSITGIALNPAAGVDDLAIRPLINDMSDNGWQYAFQGPGGAPYLTTGQRDRDGDGKYDDVQTFGQDGEKMTLEEQQRMCWLPKGMVEKIDPRDPNSGEVDATVPDEARSKDPKFLADVLGPPGAPPGVGIVCSKNL